MRMRAVASFAVVAVLAVVGLHATTGTPTCHMHGSGIWSYPDHSCTPGEWIDKLPSGRCLPHRDCPARHLLCDDESYNPRPPLSKTHKLKVQAVEEYGLPSRDAHGYVYEADHDRPVWAGGATTLSNFWPERNYDASRRSAYRLNPKDALEIEIYNRVCRSETMSPVQARHVFEVNDWTREYERYVGPRA